MQPRHHINLITALPAEAKPLIRRLGLMRLQPVGPVPIYTASGVHLAVSGPGTSAMATGVAHLHTLAPSDTAVGWLNVGICGHGSLNLGDALLADKIIEQNGQSWELRTPVDTPFQNSSLTCVSRPQTGYAPHMAYDMESAGFLASATCFASLNSISVLKIVSDNPEHGVEKINAKRVRELIAPHVDHIWDLMRRLPLND